MRMSLMRLLAARRRRRRRRRPRRRQQNPQPPDFVLRRTPSPESSKSPTNMEEENLDSTSESLNIDIEIEKKPSPRTPPLESLNIEPQSPPHRSIFEDREKIWIIWVKKGGDISEDIYNGGICVRTEGYIVASGFNIPETANLFGRSYHNTWLPLEKVDQKKNFDLLLLRVQKEKNKETGELVERAFPFFDLELEREEIYLKRGDELHCLLHRNEIPFNYHRGFCCRPFRSGDVEFARMNSNRTVRSSGDKRKKVASRPIKFLRADHVVDKDDHESAPGESDSMDESSDIVDSDDDDDEIHGNDDDEIHGNDDDDEIHGNDDDDESSFYGGDDDDDDDDDEEDEDEEDVTFLHPKMPLIQAHGLGSLFSLNGSYGCPVFDAKGRILGLFLFDRDEYQYIIPKNILFVFFTRSMTKIVEDSTNRGEKRVEGKRKGQAEDSPGDKDLKRQKSAMRSSCEKET